LFFLEDEYLENRYENYNNEDEGAILTKLDNLHSNFRPKTHFKLAVEDEDVNGNRRKYIDSVNSRKKKQIMLEGKSLMDTGLPLLNPHNVFMNRRFTITTFIAGKCECSLCKTVYHIFINLTPDGKIVKYVRTRRKECFFELLKGQIVSMR
jgi:hypothetical protein